MDPHPTRNRQIRSHVTGPGAEGSAPYTLRCVGCVAGSFLFHVVASFLQGFMCVAGSLVYACLGRPSNMLDRRTHVARRLVEPARLVIRIVVRVADSMRQRRFRAATRRFQDLVRFASDALHAGFHSAPCAFCRAAHCSRRAVDAAVVRGVLCRCRMCSQCAGECHCCDQSRYAKHLASLNGFASSSRRTRKCKRRANPQSEDAISHLDSTIVFERPFKSLAIDVFRGHRLACDSRSFSAS
jgi:hypothetical protein